MSKHLKTQFLIVFVFGLTWFLQPVNILGFQSDKTDFVNLKKLLLEAIKEDFEFVKDIQNNKQVDTQGYWLVHLKPKRAGHFALKYSFKYTHKFSHPEEGENEIYIRVGAKNCTRYNNNNHGLSNVCLGDQVIVPIVIDQTTGHQFSLKSTYQDAEKIGQEGKFYTPHYDPAEPVDNPLEKHLKYLGTRRSEMPHRACCATTVVYTAYFQAREAGRFNLFLSHGFGGDTVDKQIKINPKDALPIIIVNPGTPITGLAYHSNTITYSDNKRFSSHSGHNFLTKLLIIQPGDIFAVEYATRTEGGGIREKIMLNDTPKVTKEPELLIQKLPFVVNKDWSHNSWVVDYLPKE